MTREEVEQALDNIDKYCSCTEISLDIQNIKVYLCNDSLELHTQIEGKKFSIKENQL